MWARSDQLHAKELSQLHGRRHARLRLPNNPAIAANAIHTAAGSGTAPTAGTAGKPNWFRQTVRSAPSMTVSPLALPAARVAAPPDSPSPRCQVRKSAPSTSPSASKSASSTAGRGEIDDAQPGEERVFEHVAPAG